MNKKYKLKKSAIIIISLFLLTIIALIIFIISSLKTKSYSVEYNIDDYAISENYDNQQKIYYYEITYNDIKYNFVYPHKYQKEKKLITEVKNIKEDKYTCLVIESDVINSNPLCSYEKENIDVRLVPDKLKQKLQDNFSTAQSSSFDYKNYQIFNKEEQLLIWSYKGFNYLNKDKIDFIKLFNKDVYEIPLATKINNYLFIPDYEQDYSFNRVYLINLNNNDVKIWKLKYSISFDSRILGINNKSIYLIDNKNKKEYELVPHKQKMRIVASSNKQGVIYNKGEQEKISLNKLISSTKTFTYSNNYNYTLENNNLYLSYLNYPLKTKVSNNKIDAIVSINNDNIYYLVKDTLYKYNLKYGETKLITYYEWQFNNKNLIFINS